MSSEPGRREAKAHQRARRRADPGALYAAVRVVVVPFLRLWFRLHVSGAENVPASGGVIIAPNHKSLLDPFFVGAAAHRRVRYMAKIEIFKGPFGPLLVRLGAFPVRRGEADAEALTTAKEILRRGGAVVVFPEGTRVDQADALGAPHHGAARLALETGAPIVPAAVVGTAGLWFGPILKPRRVRVAFLAPVTGVVAGEDVRRIIDDHVWPAVRREYGRQLAAPGLAVALLTAIGVGGRIIDRRRRPAALPRLIGTVEPRRLRRERTRRARLVKRLRR